MHCNLRPPDITPVLSALSTTPCQLWSRWTNPLPMPYYSFCCWYITLRITLWPWPLTFDIKHLQCITCSETLYQIWTQWINPQRSYSDFNIWPNDLERRVTYCARLWDNVYQVWPSITNACLNYSVFYADTLTSDPLTLKVGGTSSVTWPKSVRNLSKIEQSALNYWWFRDFFAPVMSCHWPLDLELLQHFDCHSHVFKLCTKFEQTSSSAIAERPRCRVG